MVLSNEWRHNDIQQRNILFEILVASVGTSPSLEANLSLLSKQDDKHESSILKIQNEVLAFRLAE